MGFWKKFKDSIRKHQFFGLAVRRLDLMAQRPSWEDIVVDAMVGLEAIYVGSSMGEVRYKVSLRASKFLGLEGFVEELGLKVGDLPKMLKEAYDIRSEIVHGGAATEKAGKFYQKYSMEVAVFLQWCLMESLVRLTKYLARIDKGLTRTHFSMAFC